MAENYSYMYYIGMLQVEIKDLINQDMYPQAVA